MGGSVRTPAARGAAVNADPAPRPKRDLGARGPAEAGAGRPFQGSILPLLCSGGEWVLGSAAPRTNSSSAPSGLRRLHHLLPFPGPGFPLLDEPFLPTITKRSSETPPGPPLSSRTG